MNQNKRHQRTPLFSGPVLTKKPQEPQKHRWVVLLWLWKALKGLCFSLGVMVLFSIIFWGFMASQFVEKSGPPILPNKMVLYLEIDGEIADVSPQASFLTAFDEVPPTLPQIVDSIDKAANDARVQGLYVRLKSSAMTISQVQEMRDAIKRFKASGKFTKIYSSSYGDMGSGLGRMYLASIFDERWMQPLGVVSMAGLRVEVPFFRDTLDKLGITPNFYQREEYKTAYESVTNRTISDANKETLASIVSTIREAVSRDMPGDLNLSEGQFQKLVDLGLLTASESLENGLVTHLDYVDVLIDTMQEDILGDPESEARLFVPLRAYAADTARSNLAGNLQGQRRPVVAVVYANGAIMDTNAAGGDSVAAADEIAPALFEAADDERIEAVLLRVDSPGGSPVASETILRAVQRVQSKGKPVIVSMGSVAASGGYWIASSADHIFASETTITGSIGVLGGKMSAADLWQKIGVNWYRDMQWGENSGMWSFNETFTPSQEERVQAMLDQVYSAFLERVADGRGMSLEAADDVARGRVWTGTLARDKGLVDELGGLQEATNHIATLLQVDSADDLDIVQLPKPLTPIEQLAKLLAQQGMVFEGLRMQTDLIKAFEPVLQGLHVQQNNPTIIYEPLTAPR